MRRQSPAGLCVRALVIEGFDDEAIRQRLVRDHVELVDEPYLSDVRADVVLPRPFLPFDLTHVPSQAFLHHQGVTAWFRRDPDMLAAIRLLRAARAREAVEALMIGGAPAGWLTAEARRFGVMISVRGIGLFERFFLDTSVVDDRDLVAYLHERRGSPNDPIDEQDLRILAARSRNSSIGLLLTRMRLGRMPSNLEISRVLASTRTSAAVGALDATVRGRPRRAERFSAVARNVGEILAAVGDPRTDLLDGLGTVTVATDHAELPMIEELGGDRTVALEPIVPGPANGRE